MMVAAHRNIPPHEFLVPDGVEKLSISNNNTEWFIKNEHFDVQNEQEEKIKILNPFDGDEFFLSSLVRGEAQKLLLKAEVQSSESVIIWLVNGKQIGQGKKIWWNPKKGIFEIRAQLEDDKSINKTVTITIH
jgi:membrane carboxypeptidase/penicillin-binding protein PbpC